MTEAPDEKSRLKYLTAISSLKRAAGIPDHPGRVDFFGENAVCSLYTTNLESAQLLGNLMGSILASPHTEKFWRTHPDQGPQDGIEVNRSDFDIYRVEFRLPEKSLRSRTEAVHKMTQQLIDPDSRLAKRSR